MDGELTVASAGLAWNDAFAFSRIGDVFIRLPDFFEKRIGLYDRLILFRACTIRRPGLAAFTSVLSFTMRHDPRLLRSSDCVRVEPDNVDEYWNIL